MYANFFLPFLQQTYTMVIGQKILRQSLTSKTVQKHPKIKHASMLCKDIYYQYENNKVVVSQKDDTVYVCFKGCANLEDYIASIDIRNCKVQGTTVGIHNGFCERSKFFQNDVQKRIMGACSTGTVSNIVFTGHSAGGSVAQITALLVDDVMECTDINKYCYTFGSPKSGDEIFKDALEQIYGERLLRVEMYNDLVCLLPMQPQFLHAGNAIILKDNSVIKNETMKDLQEVYQYYPSDYLTLLTGLRNKNLLNHQTIAHMINEHSIEFYENSLYHVFE